MGKNKNKRLIIGIVMKPSVSNESLWEEMHVNKDFSDILYQRNVTCIGIISNGIELANKDDIRLSTEKDLTDDEKDDIIAQIKLCDGLILQGGLTSHKYEIFIAKYAIENNIPILGICAGFNNIARALDIDVDYDKELAEKHDVFSPSCCHQIIIQNNAKYLNTACKQSNTVFVNSIHKMVLNECANYTNKINIEAIAKDEGTWGIPRITVEAFSVKDTKFALAIKWHPELILNSRLTWVIFDSFIEACK